jgi:ATP synthase protein I
MQDAGERQRIAALEARIAAAKKAHLEEAPKQEDHYSAANVAWRMVTELVAGLGIGFGIGYGLDAVFGTLPWMMVLFTMIGLAAGVQTMLRTAREVEAKAAGNISPQGDIARKGSDATRDQHGD